MGEKLKKRSFPPTTVIQWQTGHRPPEFAANAGYRYLGLWKNRFFGSWRILTKTPSKSAQNRELRAFFTHFLRFPAMYGLIRALMS